MSTKKILLIEDDEPIQQLYKTVLTGAGYDVDTASDGSTGLKKAQEGGYNLVLLDVMLPQIDGLGILAGLKKSPPTKPNDSIVLLTNLNGDPLAKQAKGLGAKDCLTKVEMNPDELVQKIAQFL